MNKYVKKTIRIVISILLIVAIFSSVCEARVTSSFSGKSNLIGSAKSATKSIITSVLAVIRIVGSAVALGILLVIAIKYMIASAGERADIKKYALKRIKAM